MSKYLTLSLILSLTFAFVGCNQKAEEKEGPKVEKIKKEEAPDAAEKPVEVTKPEEKPVK